MISIFGGSGFLGTHFSAKSTLPLHIVSRNHRTAASHNILYLISTTDNYNVFSQPMLDVKTNLLVLCEVLRKLSPGETFNFVSSWFVYGEHGFSPCSEDTPCNPKGFYSITKRCAEQLVISYCETHRIKWRIFRLANLYGPGDLGSAKKNALTHLIGCLKRDEPVFLYWGGDCLRDYLHVTDCVRAIDLCLTSAPINSITNIGSGTSQVFGSLIGKAAGILNSKSEIKSRKPTRFHEQVQTRHFFMDTSRLTDLGFVPRVSMQEGLEELCSLI